jgi:HlyD family secretion protein
MKFPVKTTVALLILVAVGAAAYFPLNAHWSQGPLPKYRHAEVTKGSIVAVVTATGTVQPVLTVTVGTTVSGPIVHSYVDCNDTVYEGQLLARIDPRPYKAAVAKDRAALASLQAAQKRVEASLQQAENDLARAAALRRENKEFISDAEMDQFKFSHLQLKAQLEEAKKSVEGAEASLTATLITLENTDVRSPVDGTIIHRKLDAGSTVAAQFQIPELFVIAPDMRTIHVVANVGEADIGLIREAQRRKLPVQFTVDAYPGELFEGTIHQVRMNSTTTQTVVTYPVVIKAPNPEVEALPDAEDDEVKLKLLPGMTATVSFSRDVSGSTLRIPNSALRFYPRPEQVRPGDRPLLEGSEWVAVEDNGGGAKRSATEKAAAHRSHNERHVWVEEGGYLRAIPVVTGVSDHTYTKLVSGELTEGQELVTGALAAPRGES